MAAKLRRRPCAWRSRRRARLSQTFDLPSSYKPSILRTCSKRPSLRQLSVRNACSHYSSNRRSQGAGADRRDDLPPSRQVIKNGIYDQISFLFYWCQLFMQARIFISHFGRRTASFSLATAAVLRDCQATAVQPRQPPDTSSASFLRNTGGHSHEV